MALGRPAGSAGGWLFGWPSDLIRSYPWVRLIRGRNRDAGLPVICWLPTIRAGRILRGRAHGDVRRGCCPTGQGRPCAAAVPRGAHGGHEAHRWIRPALLGRGRRTALPGDREVQGGDPPLRGIRVRPRVERHRPRSRSTRGLAHRLLRARRAAGADGSAELPIPRTQRQPCGGSRRTRCVRALGSLGLHGRGRERRDASSSMRRNGCCGTGSISRRVSGRAAIASSRRGVPFTWRARSAFPRTRRSKPS